MRDDYLDVLNDMAELHEELRDLAHDSFKSGFATKTDSRSINAILREADKIGDLMAELGARPPAYIADAAKSVGALASTDMVTNAGGAIKAIGSGRVEGYLVRYGGKGDLSPHKDIFMKAPGTDYGRRRTSDAYVHHRMLPGLGERMLTNEAQLEPDEVGIFCKLLLDMGDQYEAALYKLTAAGKLGWSSGTAPHLVKRLRQSDGSHLVKRWVLGLDASLTPSPAGGLGMRAHAAMKTMLLDVGLDLAKPLPPRQAPATLVPGPTVGTAFDTSDYWGIRR